MPASPSRSRRAGTPPGDATADEMDAIAALATVHCGALRVSHGAEPDLRGRREARPARAVGPRCVRSVSPRPNVGLLTNIVALPRRRLLLLACESALAADRRGRSGSASTNRHYLFDVGRAGLNISGCMNACGHITSATSGILGVDKNGAEFYPDEIGGNQGETRPGARVASGKALGRSFAAARSGRDRAPRSTANLELRDSEAERFIDTVQRVGPNP